MLPEQRNKGVQGSELGLLRVGTPDLEDEAGTEAGSRVKVDPGKQLDVGLQTRFVGKFDEASFQWTKPDQGNTCKSRSGDRRGTGEKTSSELMRNAAFNCKGHLPSVFL